MGDPEQPVRRTGTVAIGRFDGGGNREERARAFLPRGEIRLVGIERDVYDTSIPQRLQYRDRGRGKKKESGSCSKKLFGGCSVACDFVDLVHCVSA